MAKFVLAYTGGEYPQSEAEGQKIMSAWIAWFAGLGDAVIDGGNPFGPAVTVSGDGSVGDGGGSSLTGYSVLSADSLEAATELAKGCPHLTVNGKVEVYSAIDM